MTVDVDHADALEWAAQYDGPPFHALLCDPPYHLTSPVSNSGNRPDDDVSEDKYNRFNQGGFMGKKWDGGDIAYRPDTWAALAKHLYPGAFGMAFASSRGWHRLAVAIEDAGLIIHPSIFGFATGQGFPKATRIQDGGEDVPGFEGHRYGLQALKPSIEPVIVFQVPYTGRPVDDITATGAGALNIDGGRVPTDGRPHIESRSDASKNTYGDGLNGSRAVGKTTEGRWPANFIILDDGAAAALDAQSGERGNNYRPNGDEHQVGDQSPVVGYASPERGNNGYPGTGGASRFFYRVRRQLDDADPIFYTAKASRAEREAGLNGRRRTTVDDGRNKSIDNPYQRGETKRVNTHPTVKPLDLTRYLATLLLPPDAYAPRRLLVPFAGSGSECIGAWQAGWEHVTGIEMVDEYVAIARARIAEWQRRGVQLELPLGGSA